MRRQVDRFVPRIIDTFNDVSLSAYTSVRKNRIRSGKIFQVRLERADVDRGAMRKILRNAKVVRNLLHRIKPGTLPDTHTHGVSRRNQAIRARHSAAISTVRVSGGPIARAIDFTGLNWPIADR